MASTTAVTTGSITASTMANTESHKFSINVRRDF